MFWKNSPFKIKTLFPGIEPSREPLSAATPVEFNVLPTPSRGRSVAFIVFHGMGQQVPYETLSLLTERMVREQTVLGEYSATPNVSVVRVKISNDPNDPPIARTQFSVERKRGAATEIVDVHIYEAYWAPLTEGKISFLETLSFLFTAGFNGILSCLRGSAFKRWMFGGFQDLPIKAGTFFAVLLALLGFAIALIPVPFFYHYWQAALTEPTRLLMWQHHRTLWFLIFLCLGLYTWILRYWVVEFVGDVAIYVSAHKVSRFEKTRTKIQKTVFDIVRQVYSARTRGDEGEDIYDKVVFVGHSLGSVIAYDALNAAISWDMAEKGNRVRVVDRTGSLITFGSPLDKTAFFFRTQVSGPHFLREALAAQKQPLILDYDKFRPQNSFRWTNIYSRADIISGRLVYYDTSESSGGIRNPVKNVVDWDAWIPFIAHVQYWNNRTLRQELYKAI